MERGNAVRKQPSMAYWLHLTNGARTSVGAHILTLEGQRDDLEHRNHLLTLDLENERRQFSAAQAALEQAEQRNEQLRDAKETMLLDHLHQELEKEHEEAKSWQAEWTKVIKRERVLRRVIEAARSFVDDDEWQEHAEAALNPVESPPVEAEEEG